MQKIVIRGGARLAGEVRVSGSKNAALPILASSLLAQGKSIYRNVPGLGDVRTMGRLLARLGAEVSPTVKGVCHVDTSHVNEHEAPYEPAAKSEKQVGEQPVTRAIHDVPGGTAPARVHQAIAAARQKAGALQQEAHAHA